MCDGVGFKWDDHIEREVDRENQECECGADDEEECTCSDEPDYCENADDERDRRREKDW